jgi:hypothetical protein
MTSKGQFWILVWQKSAERRRQLVQSIDQKVLRFSSLFTLLMALQFAVARSRLLVLYVTPRVSRRD